MIARHSPIVRVRVKFSLGALLAATTLVGLTCALTRQFGVQGLIATLDLIVVFLALARLFKVTQIVGIRIHRLTIVELLVVVAIVVVIMFVIMMVAGTEESRARERGWLPPRAWIVPAFLAVALALLTLGSLAGAGGQAISAARF